MHDGQPELFLLDLIHRGMVFRPGDRPEHHPADGQRKYRHSEPFSLAARIGSIGRAERSTRKTKSGSDESDRFSASGSGKAGGGSGSNSERSGTRDGFHDRN